MGRWLAAVGVTVGAIVLIPGVGSAAGPPSSSAPATTPRLGPDRVVLQTTAGDVVLAFYPDVAPKTVAHILALVRSGGLDGTDFFRVVPGFVVQLDANQRTTPLPAAARSVVSATVPLEVGAGLRHQRGVLSMAHYDSKPDSGGPSFSILLGDAANLDGQYTIFGDVEQGMDVVDEIAAVPLSGSRPVVPIIVRHALVTDVAGLAATTLRGPIPITGAGTATDTSTWPRLLLSTSMGDVLVILSPRDAPQHVKLIESLVAAGAYNGADLGRAAPDSYVQWFPSSSGTATSPLPVEAGTVGNVAGALTVDSRDTAQTPALTFLLADNQSLDATYTPVGWVTQGSDVLSALAGVPTGSDHRPRQTLQITKASILAGGSGVVVIRGLSTAGGSSSTPWGAFGFLVAATVLGALIFLFSKRLTPALTASAGLLVVLLGFLGLWVGLVPSADGTGQWLGMALFGGAIVVFRLMGRFERGRPIAPLPPRADEPAGADVAHVSATAEPPSVADARSGTGPPAGTADPAAEDATSPGPETAPAASVIA